MTWSALPLADLKETDNDELDRVVARLRVVASQDVQTCLDQVSRLAGQFNRRLYEARIEHQAVRDEGNVDNTTTILHRVGLGEIADSLRAVHKELEAVIRKEIGR